MKHTKRYMIIFNKWGVNSFHEDITEYDTIAEVNEEVKLLEEAYADTPRPKCRYTYGHKLTVPSHISDYIWKIANVEAFWGYLVIDFKEERIVKWGHDCLKSYNKTTDIRKLKDRFFRGEREIPKDYKWDIGEYEGWLQFRWGNGRNSLKLGENAIIDCNDGKKCQCVRHCKIKKKKYHSKTYNEEEELELDKLNEEILKEVDSTV